MRKLLYAARSDESLMLSYQKGDSLAFEVLYSRHKNNLFNFLFYSCQQQHIVEDIAHDVWMSIIRGIEQYRPVAAFRSYLYRIARNRLIDFWRKDSYQLTGSIQFSETDSEGHHIDDAMSDQQLQFQELLAAVSTLPIEQKEAFLLRQEGFSQKEIAEITDSNPETVKSRLRYATQHLRKMIEVSL